MGRGHDFVQLVDISFLCAAVGLTLTGKSASPLLCLLTRSGPAVPRRRPRGLDHRVHHPCRQARCAAGGAARAARAARATCAARAEPKRGSSAKGRRPTTELRHHHGRNAGRPCHRGHIPRGWHAARALGTIRSSNWEACALPVCRHRPGIALVTLAP
eukprot:scaffold13471_cov66-Phaeocystis_antarctica.AAC.2